MKSVIEYDKGIIGFEMLSKSEFCGRIRIDRRLNPNKKYIDGYIRYSGKITKMKMGVI